MDVEQLAIPAGILAFFMRFGYLATRIRAPDLMLDTYL
jgi:hypothetical protein